MSVLKKLWNNKRFIFVFFFSLFVYMFFCCSRNTGDAIWNYGFSYAMANGEIPYRDFTMIIPPLYNFIMSLGLRIFSDNIVYIIEHSIIITASFYLLYKLYDEKAYLFLAVMCFPFFVGFYPTYNYFLFFLFLVLLYLEKKQMNDYFVGIILSCMILTKYTVGIFFLVPSIIIYFKDKKKLLRRFVGFIIPCVLFLIYLLVTKSLFSFFDLCLFGLFDFGKSNSIVFTSYFFMAIGMLIISIFSVVKEKKEILPWYVLMSFSIMIPIFTRYHFAVYLLFFLTLFISLKWKVKKGFIRNISVVICFISVLFNFVFNGEFLRLERFSLVNNFNFYYSREGSKDSFLSVDSLYNKYKKKGDVIVLSFNAAFLKIVNEDEFTYFTILNRGNYGYHGTEKLVSKINKMEDVYFLICKDDYYFSKNDLTFGSEKSQFDYEVVDAVINKGNLIEEKFGYMVYHID